MASLLVKALIQRRKVSENKDESEELDVPTTRVAYVKVTPTISNWIQPIARRSGSSCKCGQRCGWIAIQLPVWTGL